MKHRLTRGKYASVYHLADANDNAVCGADLRRAYKIFYRSGSIYDDAVGFVSLYNMSPCKNCKKSVRKLLHDFV